MIPSDLPLVDTAAAVVAGSHGNLVHNIAGQAEYYNIGEQRLQELGCTARGARMWQVVGCSIRVFEFHLQRSSDGCRRRRVIPAG